MFSTVFSQDPPEEFQNKSIEVEISCMWKEWFYQNSAGLLNTPIKINNTSDKKTIKYITLEINAYNSVNDLMTPELGSRQCRITGPIYPGDIWKNRHTDCSTYYTRGAVKSLKVRAVSIEYMDGTSNDNPSEYIDFIYGQAQNDIFAIKMGLGAGLGLLIFALLIQ
tara:strand:- start:1214 stop:1711 length:498 start_codon:yes stop_codon:yes gene_type:complete